MLAAAAHGAGRASGRLGAGQAAAGGGGVDRSQDAGHRSQVLDIEA
jgi:hypothetical protein